MTSMASKSVTLFGSSSLLALTLSLGGACNNTDPVAGSGGGVSTGGNTSGGRSSGGQTNASGGRVNGTGGQVTSSGGDASSSGGTSMGGYAGDLGSGGEGGDASVSVCEEQIDVVLAADCTRCWPAARELCDGGNAEAVLGMAECLTGPNRCWSEFDHNSAGECMAAVIDEHKNETVEQIQMVAGLIGCSEQDALGLAAVAVELGSADQKKLLNCVGKFSSDMACKNPQVIESCLAETSYALDLCKN
jgi:hypothetical protein